MYEPGRGGAGVGSMKHAVSSSAPKTGDMGLLSVAGSSRRHRRRPAFHKPFGIAARASAIKRLHGDRTPRMRAGEIHLNGIITPGRIKRRAKSGSGGPSVTGALLFAGLPHLS